MTDDLNKELQKMITAPNMSSKVEAVGRACGYVTLGGKEYEVQLALTQNKEFWIGEKAVKKMKPYEGKD